MTTSALFAVVLSTLVVGCGQARSHNSGRTTLPKPAPGVFFVATNGNNLWSGSLPAPNAEGTDGPFETLSYAVQAARGPRDQGADRVGQRRAIYVGPGTHFLAAPIILTPRDCDLLVAAYPGAAPVLSGGRPITEWKEVTVESKRLWASDLPEVRAGTWMFRELWVNGQRATRARHPDHGYLPVVEVPDKASTWTQGQSRFRYLEDDLKPWRTITNAEVVVMNRWAESRLPILGIDAKDRMVTFSKRSVFELAPGDLYYVEGALEFLNEPGQWYLDPAAGTLYYLPRPGERLAAMQAIAPVLQQVLRLEGRPERGQFLQSVVLRGLTFAHTEWCFPSGFQAAKDKPLIWPNPEAEVGGFGQAAVGVPGAVWGQGVRDCRFEDCRFTSLGSYGLELTRGCQSNHVLRCEFADLGAGGVKLGETQIRDRDAELTRANEISDCTIHDGGKLFASAVGVWIGQSPGNRIEHNLIYDFYYTGISVGWSWGYGPALASDNVVALNHVHHIGKKSDGDGPILSDMGGIYTLGRQPGTMIRSNLWHDIAGLRYGGWGIYFDEGTSGIVAEDNIVYRTTHGGFHQHYGETNLLRNNIFASARDHQLQRSRAEPHRSFSFLTNIVYFDSGTLLDGDWSDDNYVMDWNLYFDARPGAEFDQRRLGPCSWQKWQERSHDVHSLVADPRFEAPSRGDFRLQAGSPALKLGFVPIDLSGAGPR